MGSCSRLFLLTALFLGQYPPFPPPPPPPLSPECSTTVNNWSNVTPVKKSTYFSQGCEADDDVEDQSYHQKAEPDTVSQETQENTQVSLPIC